MSPHIVMLLSNPYRPDPRVLWEAEALIGAGHRVALIAWDRQVELPAHEILGGLEIFRIHSARSSYAAGLKQALRVPSFWRAADGLGRTLVPDAVHCHDLDSLYCGVQLKRQTGCRLVYDAHENYPALMSLQLPSFSVRLLHILEDRLLRSVDHTITASRRFTAEISTRGFSPVTAIGNYADPEIFQKITPDHVATARFDLGIPQDALVVAYIGGFTKDRVILPLLQTAKLLPEVHIVLAGDGPQRSEIKALCRDTNNIHDLGWIPLEKVSLITRLSDLVYYTLRPGYPGAEYNAPNALGNALAAGVPVLANDIGDLGDTIRRYNCGYLLNELTPRAIADAIMRLQNPDLRQELAANTALAVSGGCNTTASQQKLLDIYDALLIIKKPVNR
jgi:glycosyltransferase involved in cell wall biosynthesis